MTCGTAGGTAGQIAEIRVTLTSSDHREACDSFLCVTHPVHHCVRAHHLCANTHTMAISIASEINVCRIVGIAGPVHSPTPFEIDTSLIQ